MNRSKERNELDKFKWYWENHQNKISKEGLIAIINELVKGYDNILNDIEKSELGAYV